MIFFLFSFYYYFSIICIAYVFLFVRNLDYIVPSLHVSLFFATIKRILQSLTSLIVSFVCITYLFAIVGVLIFGGLINKDPDRKQYETLQSTIYGQNNYYSLNFNSMPSAFVTLICLLRVSAWDVIAVAMEKVTYPIMRLYFVLWYLIGVLFLMNTVTTLFISGFVVILLSPCGVIYACDSLEQLEFISHLADARPHLVHDIVTLV